jgi:hypothetical protein
LSRRSHVMGSEFGLQVAREVPSQALSYLQQRWERLLEQGVRGRECLTQTKARRRSAEPITCDAAPLGTIDKKVDSEPKLSVSIESNCLLD